MALETKIMKTTAIRVTSRFFALSSARTEAVSAALLAALVGSVMLFAVGFAHSSVLHNAAHDTRHTAAFPCH